MFHFRSKDKRFFVLGSCALVMGLLIYILFRENTYLAEWVAAVIPLDGLRSCVRWLGCDLIQFYLPDYLWAFSLSCGLHILFQPKSKGSLLCTLTVFAFGALYEGLQFGGFVGGTGDIADALLYLLAGLTVNGINQIEEREK